MFTGGSIDDGCSVSLLDADGQDREDPGRAARNAPNGATSEPVQPTPLVLMSFAHSPRLVRDSTHLRDDGQLDPRCAVRVVVHSLMGNLHLRGTLVARIQISVPPRE